MTVTLSASYAAYTKTYNYTGSAQQLEIPYDGYYRIELWGAQGGSAGTRSDGGLGGYVGASIQLGKSTSLFIYVGESRTIATRAVQEASVVWYDLANDNNITFNGGGDGSSYYGLSGGGATDVRIASDAWNDAYGLRSRIIVSAGGGGALGMNYKNNKYRGGFGGGLIGGSGENGCGSTALGDGGNGTCHTGPTGGTQVNGGTKSKTVNNGIEIGDGDNGTFGTGGSAKGRYGGGGGGGWYGGTAGGITSWSVDGGAGGSSYISGHTGSVGVTSTSSSSPKSGCTTGTTNNACSLTPYINPATNTYYTFTNTVMIDGAGYAWTNTKGSLQQMPNPNGGYYASGVGHSGNGAARITYLGTSI